MVRRFVAALMLLVAAAACHALVPTTQPWSYQDGYFGGSHAGSGFAAAQAACNAFRAQRASELPSYTFGAFTLSSFNATNQKCSGMATTSSGATTGPFEALVFQAGAASCPANSDPVSGGCQCKVGYNESGGQCVQNQCNADAGKVGAVNWTEGYTLTPDEGDTKAVGGYNAPPASGSICQGGCQVSAQLQGPGVEYYVSQQPTAQGLYRRSRIMPTVGLGTPCTASDASPNSPVAPEPQCPGTVGTVGNKVACLSTPSKPVPTTDMGSPPVQPLAGNPAAGKLPTTGPGSTPGSAGRTPDAGTGGNAGGSASAAVGGKGGTGTGAGTAAGTGNTGASNSGGRVSNPGDGTEQAACGAPGQPVCAVKVDETGMPSKGDMSKAEEASDKAKTDAEKAIADAASIKAPEWSFSFQLPTGCTSYSPSGFSDFGITINPCQWQGTIHDLMSMIWAAATAFCIIGMVGRTIREA